MEKEKPWLVPPEVWRLVVLMAFETGQPAKDVALACLLNGLSCTARRGSRELQATIFAAAAKIATQRPELGRQEFVEVEEMGD